MTDEKLDVIEVLDRMALFANGRLLPEEIPEGLYAYDLRESDDGGRFILDEDSDPIFLGYAMTPQEFAGEEQAEEENLEFGGMQL